MAKPTTYAGSTVAIYIEDTGTPGTYLRPCGLNNHTVNFTKNTRDVTVPDCDDPDLPAWIERGVESLDMSVTGTGVLAAEAIDDWWTAFNSTDSINARIYIGAADDITNGRFWAGKVHVTSFEPSGERGDKAQVSVTVVSDGEMVFTVTT